jgi:hypothetical protein
LIETMILHIEHVSVPAPFHLALRFDDGDERTVDVEPLLRGPMFEPLRDPEYFAMVTLDPICRTVVWPNGADLAPEALRHLPSLTMPKTASQCRTTEDGTGR